MLSPIVTIMSHFEILFKIDVEGVAFVAEDVAEVPLVDKTTQTLVPRAAEIFSEWYDLYKDPETNLMDAQCISNFISGATKQPCSKDDKRVETIVNTYDSDKDGNINLQDFLRFYYVAASGSNPKAVQSNLKNHNVRLDLKKMSEVVDEVSYAQHEMPRYTLSAN